MRNEQKMLIFKVGRLIDGKRTEPQKDMSIIVKGSLIIDVVESKVLKGIPTKECLFFDLPGMILMPGLIDAHIHFRGEKTLDHFHELGESYEVKLLRSAVDLRELIEAGFTSVRDCGSRCGIHLRTAVEEETLIGPRIITSRLFLSQTAGHGDFVFLPQQWAMKSNKCRLADGVDEVRKAAREQLREGADFLKICTSGGIMSKRFSAQQAQFTIEEVKAVVEEARRVGTFVASHAGGNEGIKLALEGGVRTVEHGFFLDDPTVVDLMLKKSAIYVPTLIISSKLSQGEKHGVKPWALEKAKAALEFHMAAFNLARNAGVPIAMGTDFGGGPLPLGENVQELEMMVRAGMTPMEAIISATQISARALGMGEQTGTIEKGKLADMLVLDANPLNDITTLQRKERIKMVIKGGDILINKEGPMANSKDPHLHE